MVAADVPAVVVLAPCRSEDSLNCYWDARTRGNGEGRSFVNLGGVVFYLPSVPSERRNPADSSGI